MRRPGAPLVVRRDGDRPPRRWSKGPISSRSPIRTWATIRIRGEYDLSHEPPTIHTKLPDGTRLRVSYYHPMIIYGGSVMIALSEPKTMELLRDQARRVHEAFDAKAYFMEHDEMRIFNWDAASERRHLDAGPLLAANVKACIKILRDLNPGGDIYVWSDMFDPNHNAVKNYYLVKGSIAGSWEGLDREHHHRQLEFRPSRRKPQMVRRSGQSADDRRLLRRPARRPAGMARFGDESAERQRGDVHHLAEQLRRHLEKFAEAVKEHPWWTKGANREKRE